MIKLEMYRKLYAKYEVNMIQNYSVILDYIENAPYSLLL